MADPNSVNPYEQIWKTRDLRALETPLELENKLSSFERGFGRFKEQMKGTGYGLAALASQGVQNVIGENPVTQGITDWGLEGYNETTAKSQPGAMYAPKVAKIEDIKTPSDALEWGAGLLGEQLPLAGSLLLTGGVGGAVARLGANAAVKDIAGAAVGSAVKKGVEQGALKAVEGELVTGAMRKAASKALLDTTLKGAAITGFAGTAGLEGGQSFGGSVQEGAKPEDAVKSAIAVGGLNGALELLAPFVIAKKMGLGEYAKKSIADIIFNDADLSKKAIALATAKELSARGIKGFAQGAAVEGITEGLQELTSIAGERWAKNSQLFADLTDEDWSRIKNSTAGGAFIGGGLSGAGATVSGPQTEQTKVQTKITVPAPAQSKLDVLKANQAKLVEQINETIKAGDTKKAEELQAIKDIYDLAINKTQEVIPAQEKSALEGELVQEPAKETPVSEVAPVVEANAPTLETVKPTEEEMANGQVQAQTEAPLTEPPVQEPSNIIASSLASTWEGATPETRAQWLKDSGHSEDFSTRKAVEWDTFDKIPPAIAQQRLPKVMPQEVKVPEITAQPETDTAVKSNAAPLYSRPLQEPTTDFFAEDETPQATDATMEEFEAVRKQFQEKQSNTPVKQWFGKGTPGVTATPEGEPITLYHGTNNPDFYEWDSTRASEASGHPTSGLGFFMTADKGSAARYGSNLLELHAKINNPYTLTDADLTSIETLADATALREKLIKRGYDGAVVTAPGAKPYVIAFQKNQIKLTSNKNPTTGPDMRFSKPAQGKVVTPEMDAEYLAAVERGDMEAAQRMVDETAKEVGYTVKAYHGTPITDGFTEFRDGHAAQRVKGIYFTKNKKEARKYTKKDGKIDSGPVLEVALELKNPAYRADLDKLGFKGDGEANRQALIDQGFDGLIDDFMDEIVVFNPNQIKSVDPITRDDTGNVIPLSQRFNTTTPDIRYTQQPGTITIPLQDLHSNINSVMGEGWLQQAIDLGLVEVIEGPGPNGESGSWSGDRIRLYTGSMPKNGSPAGVLLHEGKHATFADVLGDSLQEYVKDLHALAKNGNKVAQDAITHSVLAAADTLGIKHNLLNGGNRADFENLRAIIEARRPGLLAEEELAYFVQYGTDAQGGAGFLRRLINAIKAWFAQTRLGQRMKELGLGFELTDAMAVEWAKTGLNMSLQEAKQATRVRARIEKQAANMPASVRLGKALEALENADPLYSMGIKEMREQLWNDPTDPRLEIVNKPGLLQKFRADFVDFFGEMEKKSKNVYDTYILQRAKKGARIEKSRQTYLLPLRELIANSPWNAKEVGDMLAARHIKVDNVNTDLAERASQGYTKELLKALPSTQQKKLKQARVNVKAGKMPDGSVYKDANGNVVAMSARTKRKLMFDLMNQYAPFEIANTAGVQELNQEWEIFKDAAGGFSNGGIAKGIVRTVDNVLAPASKAPAKFDEIANLFDAMNRHTLDILEEGGLITAREHARLLTSKSAYAPLRRESYNIDRETELLFQKASAGGSKQIGTRAGTANLSEPTLVLQNALAKLEATAAAAERNLANQELYNTIMTDREGWKPWFTIADKDQYVTHDEDGFLQEKHATASSRGDIVLIKDGKKIVIQPNMHNERATGFVRAVNNMDVQALNGPMKIMSWVNSLIRWTNISASPIFLMTNLIRDPLTAAYNLQATEAAEYSKDIFLNWKRAFKALKKVYIDNNRDLTDADVKMLEKFEKAGGRTSFVLSLKEMDDNSFSNFEGQVARRQGSMKYLMKAKDTWLDGIENYNILFENIMRFSTFMTLQEKSQGKISEQRAARIAQDITTNFSRRGYKSQMLGVWWLFFNASVQGNYQVLRNLMSSKRVQVAVGGTIATAVMLDVLGRALTDDWDEIPEWDKERNIILPIKVGGDFVKIPAPWVYNVFWRMGGMIGETLAGKRKPQDTILDMAALTFTTLDPLGKPGSLAQAISPTAADPFVQILENKNFAGNPIGPEGYPGASTKANSELLWSTTPKGYQSFARFVNEVTGGSAVESGKIDLRPGDYQLLADFLTGSFGKFLTDTTFGFANKLDKGIEGPKDIPIIKEFFSDPSNPMMVQKYHTNIATIYGAHRLEQMYVKGPERDLIKLQEVREKRGNELRMYAQAQDVEKQLKSLRVKLRAAQNREDTGREKELKEKMNKVQEQFNKKFEQNVK